MRIKRVAALLAALLVLSIAFAIWLLHAPSPPIARLVSVQSGIRDDQGFEMRLLTFAFTNVGPHYLWIKGSPKPDQARISEKWVKIEHDWIDESMPTSQLIPGHEREWFLQLPAGTDACRISLLYTGPAWSLKGYCGSLATRSPKWLASKIPRNSWTRFWRWVGFPGSEPSSNWHKTTMELQLPIEAGPEPHFSQSHI